MKCLFTGAAFGLAAFLLGGCATAPTSPPWYYCFPVSLTLRSTGQSAQALECKPYPGEMPYATDSPKEGV